MHEESNNSQPPAAGTGLSRRGFVYGTTAAAAGAVLLRRLPCPLSHSAGHGVTPAGHVVPLAGSSGAFTFNQAGQSGVGANGVLTLSVTVPSTTDNSLLVAAILSADPNGAFTTTTAGWHRASAGQGPGGSGRAEIWYYPGTPLSPGTGTGGGTFSATFQTTSGVTCRGVIAEFGVPQNVPAPMIAVLDTTGQASGKDTGNTGGSFSLTPAAGNVGNALGVSVAGEFFSKAVSGSWSAPSGFAPIRTLGGTVVGPWASWYHLNLGAGVQQPIVASYSDANPPAGTVENGWAFAFAAFRGVVFPGIYLDGGENTNIVALDPTNQVLVLGGDVEGMWRSADFGDHWQLSQDGIWGAAWRCTASVAWSQAEAGEVYACVGKDASKGDGGFMVSTDGGVTWSMRASPGQPAPGQYPFLVFQANSVDDFLLNGEGVDADRSVGHLIAQDPTPGNSYLYLATYNQGIVRSHNDDGNTWKQIGLTTANNDTYFPRALAIDPDSLGTLYAGLWKRTVNSATFGGLYVTTNARTMSPAWNRVPTSPTGVPATSTVSDIRVLGGNVYVTYKDFGVYLYKPGTGAWVALVTGSSYGLWTSLDVYQSDSSHVAVVAACGSNTATGSTGHTNVVQVTVNPATGAVGTVIDLTGSATINTGTVPPDNQPWWHGGDSFANWLGGKNFHNAHVLVNPQNSKQIFVTGASGCFRTDNADASPTTGIKWDVAVNGAPAIACLDIAVDPNQADHYVVCGTDYAFIDVSGDSSGFGTTTGSGAKTTVTGPGTLNGSKLETHAASFDQRAVITANGTSYNHVVYVAVHNKFGQGTENANGDVQWTSDDHSVWHSTGLHTALAAFNNGQPGDTAVTGVYAGNAASGPYVVAAVIGNGIWKSAVPADLSTWSWSQVNPNVGTAGSTVQQIPIVANAAGTILYCFDRDAATIYRAKNNAGGNWVPIWTMSGSPWNQRVTDPRSGWLAVNPKADELWVATSQSIWKLPGASTGVVGGLITPVDMSTNSSTNLFPEGCGGLAFTTKSATLYAVSLNGQTQSSTQLRSLPNGGITDNWALAADPGNSFGSYISWPGPARMTALVPMTATTQTLLVGSNPNLGIYGTVNA